MVEISAATVVVVGSRFSLPISTTHCLVGAVSGVGLLEGRRGFNAMLLLRFFIGWVATLIVAALTSAAFTAQARCGSVWGECCGARCCLAATRRAARASPCLARWPPLPAPFPNSPTDSLPSSCCRQGIYSPNNFTAGRRTDVGDYLKETSAQISAVSVVD